MLLVMTNDFNSHLFIFFCVNSHIPCFLWTEFDLNLPLDEFGGVDFEFVQNMTGM